MAVLAKFTGAMTLSEYDTLRFAVGWAHHQPAGAIFHVASLSAAGSVCIVEIWQSADALSAFVTQRLTPILRTLRIEPLAMVTYPVDTMLAYPTVDPYCV